MDSVFSELYRRALKAAVPRALTGYAQAGEVGAAILTKSGSIYTGVCLDTACSMGFCAEQAAAAAMLTAGENEISRLVAVNSAGRILPPCGRCREFLTQLSPRAAEALVMVDSDTVLRLGDQRPCDWKQE